MPGNQPEANLCFKPLFTLSERSSTYFLAMPNSMLMRSTSSEELVKVRDGVTTSASCFLDSAHMTAAPSMGLRARRSSFQHRMPATSPRASWRMSSPNLGRPGSLADMDSSTTLATTTPRLLAHA